MFREYPRVVDRYVEDAAAARYQNGINLKCIPQFGSQTDRFRTIVSGTAVGD